MNVTIFWVHAMECMCAQTRPRFNLYSHPKEFLGNGVESEPMLSPREKSCLQEAQRRVEPMTLHHAGQWAQHTSNWAIRAPLHYSLKAIFTWALCNIVKKKAPYRFLYIYRTAPIHENNTHTHPQTATTLQSTATTTFNFQAHVQPVSVPSVWGKWQRQQTDNSCVDVAHTFPPVVDMARPYGSTCVLLISVYLRLLLCVLTFRACVRACAHACVCACVSEWVHKRMRERETERETEGARDRERVCFSVCVCVRVCLSGCTREWERERQRKKQRERETESVCVCVCVCVWVGAQENERERDRERNKEGARDRERVCFSVCVCVYVCVCVSLLLTTTTSMLSAMFFTVCALTALPPSTSKSMSNQCQCHQCGGSDSDSRQTTAVLMWHTLSPQ